MFAEKYFSSYIHSGVVLLSFCRCYLLPSFPLYVHRHAAPATVVWPCSALDRNPSNMSMHDFRLCCCLGCGDPILEAQTCIQHRTITSSNSSWELSVWPRRRSKTPMLFRITMEKRGTDDEFVNTRAWQMTLVFSKKANDFRNVFVFFVVLVVPVSSTWEDNL